MSIPRVSSVEQAEQAIRRLRLRRFLQLGQISLEELRASMAKLEMMPPPDRDAMLSRASRIQRHRKITLAVCLAILGLVTLALPWAEAAVDDWAAHEEAKAAQAYRRTP